MIGKTLKKLSSQTLVFFSILFLHVVLFFIFKFVFFLIFVGNSNTDAVEVSDFFKAFSLGLKFDTRLAGILSLPYFLGIFFCTKKIQNSKYFKYSLGIFSSVFFSLCLIIYMGDIGFYDYLGEKIGVQAGRFLKNPLISLEMVSQSYPLFFIVLGFTGVVFLFGKLVFKVQSIKYRKGSTVLSIFTAFFVITYCVYGQLSFYPLRWSQAYFHPNKFLSSIAINPVLHLFNTYKFSKNSVDVKDVKKTFGPIKEYFEFASNDFSFLREKKFKENAKTYNVVLVLLESWAASKVGGFGNKAKATPYFDKISRSGHLFKRHFTPTEGTARGVFGVLTGVPDVTNFKTSSRNPLVIDQHLLPSELATKSDYQSFYFLGGSANWGNIRGIFSNNIPRVKIFEEGDYGGNKKNDVWGISDFDLFMKAIETFSIEKKPFIAFIQTAGFHRPYTIPNNVPGFKEKQLDESLLKDSSFISLDQYNSMRLQDFSLGKFIEKASSEDYFNDTIFVFFGDHGIQTIPSDNLPKGYFEHKLHKFHVPLLFYAPKIIAPKSDDQIASLLDVMPTVMGVLRHPYHYRGLGRDLLSQNPKSEPVAFIKTFPVRGDTGLIMGDYFYSSTPTRSGLYIYEGEGRENLREKESEKYIFMKNLHESFLNSSSYLIENNKKLK